MFILPFITIISANNYIGPSWAKLPTMLFDEKHRSTNVGFLLYYLIIMSFLSP